MPVRAVKDWLSEYKALRDSEIHSYANTLRERTDLVQGLHKLFDDDTAQQEVLDPVCHQLFDFYRCGNSELKRFTIEAIPAMITAYLKGISRNDKKRCSGIEACLLGIYNLEVLGDDGKPIVKTFTIPTLAVASVYHEPPSLAALALTESALLKHHSEEHVKISVGPQQQVERVHSQNRLTTLTSILNLYNADIGNLSARSHYTLCKMASRLCRTGFDNITNDYNPIVNGNDPAPSQSPQPDRSRRGIQFQNDPRIQISAAFLVELLNGIYFAMFNGQAREGIQALEDIHQRACYELFPDVLLVTNAIKNSLMYNPSGQPHDGPMGISIALSPSQASPAFSKSAITNASFRAKKLPDDIEVLPTETPHTPTSSSKRPSASPLSKEEELLINFRMTQKDVLNYYDHEILAQDKILQKLKLDKSNKSRSYGGVVGSLLRRSSSGSKFKRSFSRSSSRDSDKSSSSGRKGRSSSQIGKGGASRSAASSAPSGKTEDIDVPDEQSGQTSAGIGNDLPPNYEEAQASSIGAAGTTTGEDRSSTVVSMTGATATVTTTTTTTKLSAGAKIGKPLKSIMKKGSSASDKQDKADKASRKKEAEAAKRERKSLGPSATTTATTAGEVSQPDSSHCNPTHSVSMTTGLGLGGVGQNGGGGMAGTGGAEAADPSMVGVSVIRNSSSATGRFQMVDYVDLKASNQSGGHKRTASLSEDTTGVKVTGSHANAQTTDREGSERSLTGEEESLDTAM